MAKKSAKKERYGFSRVLKNIYKRGDTYYLQFMCDGKRIIEAVDDNIRNAQAMLGIRLKEVKEGRYFDKPKGKQLFFKELTRRYLDEVEGKVGTAQLKPKTCQRYKTSIKMLNERFGEKRVKDIGFEQVENYRKERLGDSVSPATVNRDITLLKAIMNWAVKKGLLNENPVRQVKKMEETGERRPELSGDDEERLIEACPNWLKPVVIIAIYTGMRMGEILSLRWKDVDLKKGSIAIRGETTKTRKGRSIPMTARVREIVEALPRGLHGDMPLFPSGKGHERRVGKVSGKFGEVIKKLKGQFGGIWEDFRFHDLRHVFATRLIERGVNIRVIQGLLGHKTLAMIIRYGDVTAEAKRQAIQQLN